MRYELSATDMSCGHCKMTIEKTLSALGCQGVEVELAAKRIHLDAAPEALPSVLAALEEEGFPATVVAGA